MNEHFWILTSLLLIPISGALLSLAVPKGSKIISILASVLTLGITLMLSCRIGQADIGFSVPWITELGSNFSLSVTKSNYVMLLLTALIATMVFVFNNDDSKDSGRFNGLLGFSLAGLMGVFLANDLLLFYFFWELALIPVYFLASQWGGENRIKTSFKFFVYTFLGSLVLLGGIIYLYLQNADRSFEYNSILQVAQNLSYNEQVSLFIMFFVAFAIKMPIFPFHTWQPDAYQQTYTPVTIILSALMVKMGLYAVIKWLTPLFPDGFYALQSTIMVLSLIGILYGSILAFRQTNIKRLVAYSSIAHIGLMAMAVFADKTVGHDAAVLQMFNHGINIAGMWFIIWLLEKNYGTQDMTQMGKLAQWAPSVTVLFVLISLANIGLPLTNAFIGEFMLFHAVMQSSLEYHILYMVLAGLGIILSAVYTLNMIQKVAYLQSEGVSIEKTFVITVGQWIVLIVLAIIILVLGVYPQFILQFIQG